MNLIEILDLAPHGPDTFVGAGPHYPWGGLYGGQIVAQALQAATSTVDPQFVVHSLRAYFIRRGDHSEPVRYEVDRIRNGRSFCTRRVVARQSVGAILNLEASYHAPEEAADIETVAIPPDVPATRRACAGVVEPGVRAGLRARRAARPGQPQRSRPGRGLAAGDATRSRPTTRPCTRAGWPTCPTTCRPTPSCGPTRWAASRARC